MQQLGSTFAFDITESNGIETVVFEGVVDEFAQLVLVQPKAQEVVLDLAGVERFNSVGVREFTTFIKRLKGRTLRAVRCSQAVVSQANLVAGFLGDAEIESFYVPLFCAACDHEDEDLVVRKDYSDAGLKPSNCANCSAPMTFDGQTGDMSFYLSFMDPSSY